MSDIYVSVFWKTTLTWIATLLIGTAAFCWGGSFGDIEINFKEYLIICLAAANYICLLLIPNFFLFFFLANKKMSFIRRMAILSGWILFISLLEWYVIIPILIRNTNVDGDFFSEVFLPFAITHFLILIAVNIKNPVRKIVG
jgi:hypothetical protein